MWNDVFGGCLVKVYLVGGDVGCVDCFLSVFFGGVGFDEEYDVVVVE